MGTTRGTSGVFGFGSTIGDPMKSPDKPKTQLQRAKLIRERYKRWFPILDELKQDLAGLLDEASNPPPDGVSDGTIGETQFGQLRSIEKATRNLLVALLFDSKD
jgi:hypothetical protein